MNKINLITLAQKTSDAINQTYKDQLLACPGVDRISYAEDQLLPPNYVTVINVTDNPNEMVEFHLYVDIDGPCIVNDRNAPDTVVIGDFVIIRKKLAHELFDLAEHVRKEMCKDNGYTYLAYLQPSIYFFTRYFYSYQILLTQVPRKLSFSELIFGKSTTFSKISHSQKLVLAFFFCLNIVLWSNSDFNALQSAHKAFQLLSSDRTFRYTCKILMI